jgi:hypothetical protein
MNSYRIVQFEAICKLLKTESQENARWIREGWTGAELKEERGRGGGT